MCFLVHDKYKVCKTAKKDIPCWKMVNGAYRSFYIYRASIIYKKLGVYIAKDCNNKEIKSLKKVKSIFGNYYTINEGIHSYFINHINYGIIVKHHYIYCVIPKGTKYYYNSCHDEYVSLSIRRIRKLEFKELLKNKRYKHVFLYR